MIYWSYRKDPYCILLLSVMPIDAAQKKDDEIRLIGSWDLGVKVLPTGHNTGQVIIKLGSHYVWYVFVMRDASWFAHRVYEEICEIWVDVSFVHSSHMVHQVGGKLTYIKANESQISAIYYLIQTIIYRNTSNIGILASARMDFSMIYHGVGARYGVQIFRFFGKWTHHLESKGKVTQKQKCGGRSLAST